jgi:hypothetical protein
VSSPSVERQALRYAGFLTAGLAVVGSIVGLAVAGLPGTFSALVGAVLASVFMGLTAASVLVADRVSRGKPIGGTYFGIIIGTWVLKLIVFTVVAFLARDLPWMEPYLFFGAVLVAVIGSLILDAVALTRARVPYVGNIALPGDKKPENTA